MIARPPADAIHIRAYRPADFEPLWRLDQQCFEPGIAYARGELRAFLSRKTAEVLVAECAGSVVGFVLGARPRRDEAHLITLDVAPSTRRRGLGRQLLAELEDRLRALGVRRIRLEVAVDNTGAIAFYEQLGYATQGRIPDYYGPDLHAWAMEKSLR